jgi:lipopolysaccharide export system protein LptA
MKRVLLNLFPLLLSAALPLGLQALPDDRDQPIEILSETAELRDQEGYAVYSGSVRMTQGSLEVDADKIELFFKESDLERAVIYGGKDKQAYFQQTPNPGEKPVRGLSDRIVYQSSDSQIRLLGTSEREAIFCQKGSEQKGQRILYDTNTDVMKAKARTRTVFRPDSAPGSCDHIRSPHRKP